MLVACNNKQTTNNDMKQELELTQEWDKVFPLNDKVSHKKVTFETQYGLTLAADLYMPAASEKGKVKSEKLPAIAVSGPFGAVKEQCSGLYAMKMAERGFVALAFDPSYTGESSGEPRRTASPDINTEDFMAAVDFLSKQDNVDAEKIGIIGICGWGGIALNAAAADTRIKATVASTMYDMTRVSGNGYFDADDNEAARHAARETLAGQRLSNPVAMAGGVPDSVTAVCQGLLRLLQDPARLSCPQRQLQRRLARHRHSGLCQQPFPLLHQRDPLCRARNARCRCPLTLLWRSCLSLYGGGSCRGLQVCR